MTCPSCGQRKARRSCPALGQEICAICCGTKRLVEIRCPEGCGYLAASRHHPAAVVQRQQQRDFVALAPTLRDLGEHQQQLALVLLGTVAAHAAREALDRITDEDVSAAADALASTYETASRGVIYEHRPQSAPARHLGTAFRELVEDIARTGGGQQIERDAAAALRAIGRGVGAARAMLGPGPRAYIDLVGRLIRPAAARSEALAAPGAGDLILPG
jgi:hypothetical protein